MAGGEQPAVSYAGESMGLLRAVAAVATGLLVAAGARGQVGSPVLAVRPPSGFSREVLLWPEGAPKGAGEGRCRRSEAVCVPRAE